MSTCISLLRVGKIASAHIEKTQNIKILDKIEELWQLYFENLFRGKSTAKWQLGVKYQNELSKLGFGLAYILDETYIDKRLYKIIERRFFESRKSQSHGVPRNGLSRRKQRLNRSLDDLRISKNNGRHELMHSLLFRYLDWNQSWMRQTAEVYDIQIYSTLKWLWPFHLINSFPAYHHYLLKHSLSKLSSLIKAWTCLIFPT